MEFKKWEKGLLRPDGQPGFNTPSGKFEIASSLLAEHGYEPLPVYTEPQEGPLSRPDLARRFPLVFNSGSRTYFDFRSQHHGVRGLAGRLPEPFVTMSGVDAAARGIGNNDWVWVETGRGRMRFRARVTDAMISGAIDATMGGGGPLGPEAWQNCNVNELTDINSYDPISGFPIYKTLLCEVRKAEAAAGAGEDSAKVCSAEEAEMRESDSPMVEAAGGPVYLDHNATTPLDPEALTAMLPYMQQQFGNPSSIHNLGRDARQAVEQARRSLGQVLHCAAGRLVFTGGGSEANNLAILGAVRALGKKTGHIITSAVEHPSVLGPCRALEKEGFQLTILPVDGFGMVEPAILAATLRPDTLLVSIMAANNETGTIQPIPELAAVARERSILFHTDAVQAFGKIDCEVESWGVDLLSLSSHKIYGPKGVGALFVRQGIELRPLIHGGGQEQGRRSGTENVAGIVGFGKAGELAAHRLNNGIAQRLSLLRDRLEAGIRAALPEARRNGHPTARLPNTLNITLPAIRGESLVLFLSRRNIHFSSGSACKSGNPNPSHALLAMGLSAEDAHCAVRFSLGKEITPEEIDYAVSCLAELMQESSRAVRFVPCR